MAGIFDGASGRCSARLPKPDALLSLLLVVVAHAAIVVALSAEQAVSKEIGAEQLVQASLIVEAPIQPPAPEPVVQPEPESPKPEPPKPEPPKPEPPRLVEAPKPTLATSAPAPTPPTEPAPKPRAIPAVTPPVSSVAQAAPAPAPAPRIPPRFDAAYLDNPVPHYPTRSRRLGEEGKVLLRVFVKADGSPGEVEVYRRSGFPRLDTAAIEAVRQWRFVPARQGTEQVGAWVLVPVAFSLRS